MEDHKDEGMDEIWKIIRYFENYSVSNYGQIRAERSGRIMALYENQYGVVCVGMMDGGIQKHRSVPLLVAKAFVPRKFGPFDTPINLDGDRHNNRADNLLWRPRWFAIKYVQQFKYPYQYPIDYPIINTRTGEISENSLACVKRYGILEKDLVEGIINRTFVWPVYTLFEIYEN